MDGGQIPPDFRAKASLRLRDITWRQAFDVLLSPIDYAYLCNGKTVVVMSREEYNRLPQVERSYPCRFIDAPELAQAITEKFVQTFREHVQVNGHTVTAQLHPAHVERIDEIFERLDIPSNSDPYRPTLEWPDEVPPEVLDVPPPEEPWNRLGEPDILLTNIFILRWVNARKMAGMLRLLFDKELDKIHEDARSNALVVTAYPLQLRRAQLACAYLDDRAWYFRAAQNASKENPPVVEGEHPGLTRRDHFCIFAPPDRFIRMLRDHLDASVHEEVVTASEHVIAIFVRPEHLPALDGLLEEADQPGKLPYFPSYLVWPDEYPPGISTGLQQPPPPAEPVKVVDAYWYPLRWVDAARVAERIRPLLDPATESVRVDYLYNQVSVATRRTVFCELCAFLDQREWYQRPPPDKP